MFKYGFSNQFCRETIYSPMDHGRQGTMAMVTWSCVLLCPSKFESFGHGAVSQFSFSRNTGLMRIHFLKTIFVSTIPER